jgi:hypothetical protein
MHLIIKDWVWITQVGRKTLLQRRLRRSLRRSLRPSIGIGALEQELAASPKALDGDFSDFPAAGASYGAM